MWYELQVDEGWVNSNWTYYYIKLNCSAVLVHCHTRNNIDIIYARYLGSNTGLYGDPNAENKRTLCVLENLFLL